MSIFADINFGAERFRNYLKGSIMIISLIGIELFACYAIGSHYNYPAYGIYAGLFLSFVALPVQILLGKKIVLKRTFAHPMEEFDKSDRISIQMSNQLAERAGLNHPPKLYTIVSACPNAFSVGLSEKGAVICLTKALLENFDEEEIKAVISHEIIHILQKDIFLNQLVIGLVSPILGLIYLLESLAHQNAEIRNDVTFSDYFFDVHYRHRRGVMGLHYIIHFLVLIFINPISILFCNLCHLGISKNREYVADYYGVYLCNNIDSFVSVLSKMSCARFERRDREALGGAQLSSLYFDYPKGEVISTHPPMAERIKRVLSLQ